MSETQLFLILSGHFYCLMSQVQGRRQFSPSSMIVFLENNQKSDLAQEITGKKKIYNQKRKKKIKLYRIHDWMPYQKTILVKKRDQKWCRCECVGKVEDVREWWKGSYIEIIPQNFKMEKVLNKHEQKGKDKTTLSNYQKKLS